jgi:phage-related protein
MVNYLHRILAPMVKGLCAGLLTLVLVGVGVLGMANPALAASEGTLAETMELKMSKAAQEFVSSILDEYEDVLSDSFSATLKPLKSVTKDLTKQLGKVAVSPTPDTTLLEPKITASQTALEAASTSFQALISDTDAFKASLAATPAQLKEAIDTQLGTKFDDLQAAFDGISTALATLSQDTSSLDVSDATAAVGRLTEDTTALTQAIELAKVTISSFGD